MWTYPRQICYMTPARLGWSWMTDGKCRAVTPGKWAALTAPSWNTSIGADCTSAAVTVANLRFVAFGRQSDLSSLRCSLPREQVSFRLKRRINSCRLCRTDRIGVLAVRLKPFDDLMRDRRCRVLLGWTAEGGCPYVSIGEVVTVQIEREFPGTYLETRRRIQG